MADGFGVKLRVQRGALRVEDGIGVDRRERVFYRATSGLKRVVVLGRTGYAGLEVFRWLADIEAAYVQIDNDGRVLATFGPRGTDRPSLRRAQAMASQSPQALALSRWLVAAKLAAQRAALAQFGDRLSVDEAINVIAAYQQAVVEAQTVGELRASEAWAAAAYWQGSCPARGAVRQTRRRSRPDALANVRRSLVAAGQRPRDWRPTPPMRSSISWQESSNRSRRWRPVRWVSTRAWG